MVWLGVLCVLLAAALVVYVTATERQMRGLSASLPSVPARGGASVGISHGGARGVGP